MISPFPVSLWAPSGLWSPLSVAATWWFDFSDLTTLYTDSGRTTLISANGDPLGGVTDKGGAGHHLAQSTAGSRPLSSWAAQNGLAVATFDGTDDWLQASLSMPQPNYVATVARYTTVSTSPILDGAGNDLRIWSSNASTFISLYCGGQLDSGATTPAAWHLIEALFNGASSKIWIDGVLAASGSIGTAAATAITFGSQRAQNTYAACQVGEAFRVGAVPSAGDQASALAYARAKWATP
jgi:hypothetical protein